VHEQRGPTVLASGRGAWLTDASGHELLDAFAGLWCVNVGYGRRAWCRPRPSRCAAAVRDRLLPLQQRAGDPPGREAGRRSRRIADPRLPDARRLRGDRRRGALHRAVLQRDGRPSKKQFIALERGYHGSSSTGAGLTALPAFHRGFDLPLPTQHYIPSPYPYRHADGADPQALIAASVAALRAKVAELGADNVAAFFCEPIQGSGGVIVPPKGWLQGDARRRARARHPVRRRRGHHRLRRTGPMFACDAEGVEPDLMTWPRA
jgi:adenosylmethionine-8-amino-7-oxononanoate aminotransferase